MAHLLHLVHEMFSDAPVLQGTGLLSDLIVGQTQLSPSSSAALPHQGGLKDSLE